MLLSTGLCRDCTPTTNAQNFTILKQLLSFDVGVPGLALVCRWTQILQYGRAVVSSGTGQWFRCVTHKQPGIVAAAAAASTATAVACFCGMAMFQAHAA